MPEIKAFRGLRYQKKSVGSLASVLAPPYDIISARRQGELYKKNPCNVIRLILGRSEKGDCVRRNQYTRARQLLKEWTSKGVLVKDQAPSVYVYAQDYRVYGKLKTRIGFMAVMRLAEKNVFKHENTLAAPKRDRTALLREVRTNLSPIFGLFEDKKGAAQRILKDAMKLKPAVDVSLEGVRHKLYVEDRQGPVSRLLSILKPKPMYIADGHHRFEVACRHRRRMRAKFPKAQDPGWDFVMTYFSDFAHNPFEIFPTHRLIKIPLSMKDPLEILKTRGLLRRARNLAEVLRVLSRTRAQSRPASYSFGIYQKKAGFLILDLDPSLLRKIGNHPVDRLDVAVLHRHLIEPCFKIRSIEKSSAIDFTRDPRRAKTRVDGGSFDLAFFLRPPSLNEMILVSKKGFKMPQKSTYFYPKLLSGLVFHPLDDGANL